MVHHAEGDVAIHTQLVLESLQSLKEFQEFDEQTREVGKLMVIPDCS
jgi:hypothetical protein